MTKRSGSETRKRNVLLTARFTPQEAATIRQISDRTGVTVASLLRRALLDTPPPRATRRPPADMRAIARLLGQLGKIGSNINQIAHYLNAGRPLNRIEDSIELALRDLAELRIVCLQALGQERRRGAKDQEYDED
jgi:Mobilization protein NikA